MLRRVRHSSSPAPRPRRASTDGATAPAASARGPRFVAGGAVPPGSRRTLAQHLTPTGTLAGLPEPRGFAKLSVQTARALAEVPVQVSLNGGWTRPVTCTGLTALVLQADAALDETLDLEALASLPDVVIDELLQHAPPGFWSPARVTVMLPPYAAHLAALWANGLGESVAAWRRGVSVAEAALRHLFTFGPAASTEVEVDAAAATWLADVPERYRPTVQAFASLERNCVAATESGLQRLVAEWFQAAASQVAAPGLLRVWGRQRALAELPGVAHAVAADLGVASGPTVYRQDRAEWRKALPKGPGLGAWLGAVGWRLLHG
jgi:hypothetical protein